MQVRDLMEALSDMDQDAKVRIAYQQRYPLYGGSAGVVSNDEDGETFVYIGCSDNESEYLDRDIVEQGVFERWS